jgi:TusA-related sulfurtransferase
MATEVLDLRGLKCPQPTLKMTLKVIKMNKGDILEVMADCKSFESDLKGWSERSKKAVLWVREEEDYKRCQVQV